MPHKKKLFTKENSTTFTLLPGNLNVVNADGESLQSVFVPVSRKYKPGPSLLMSKHAAALSNLEPDDDDIEGLFDDESTVDDSNAVEIIIEGMLSDRKEVSRLLKEFGTIDDVDNDNYDDDYEEVEDRKNSKQYSPGNYQNSSENWKMFNEKFEKILEEYTPDKIGALDDDDDIRHMQMASPKPFTHYIDDHHEELQLVLGDCDESLKEKILDYVEDSGDEKIVEIVTEKPLEYDCESVLSTYSNMYNHPTVIKEEKVRRIRNTSHTSHNESESDNELHSKLMTNTSNIRKKDETSEERKERQRRFKEAKKLRRELKKQNKEAFKEEKKFQSLKDQQNDGMKLL